MPSQRRSDRVPEKVLGPYAEPRRRPLDEDEQMYKLLLEMGFSVGAILEAVETFPRRRMAFLKIHEILEVLLCGP